SRKLRIVGADGDASAINHLRQRESVRCADAVIDDETRRAEATAASKDEVAAGGVGRKYRNGVALIGQCVLRRERTGDRICGETESPARSGHVAEDVNICPLERDG